MCGIMLEVVKRCVSNQLEEITEAGSLLAGGHTIEDDEPKFGLAVTGIVHPRKYWRNRGAMPEDVVILTKPIGSGVLFNANIKKRISDEAMEQCVSVLTTALNTYNRGLVAGTIRFEEDLPPWHKEIVYDPQTRGGLLVAVPESQGEAAVKALQVEGVRWASVVGKVTPLRGSNHLVFK
jgi:selenophosphate synthase